MNIFAVNTDPQLAAAVLPEKYLTKLPVETCQMLAITYSPWYNDWGTLPKADGTPYKTERGAFRNHPCTQWAAANIHNTAWLILHGIALCDEYNKVYGKTHACMNTLSQASLILYSHTRSSLHELALLVDDWARAMPDDIKNDTSIPTWDAYRKYLNTKEWITHDYKRDPSRKPLWIH